MENQEAIMSAHLSGEDVEVFRKIKQKEMEMPEDLAIDYLGRNVYFTESARKIIGVCSIYRKHCIVVIKEKVDKPRGIAVYPEKGVLFYTDWGEYSLCLWARYDIK